MTINVNTSRNEYTATSGQTVFNFTFKIYTATDLNVYVTPAGQECNDVTDLTEAYTVTGVGLEDGGSITLNTGAGANDLVTIVSAIPSSRTTDYQSNGDFTPETVNNDIDRAISLIKQVEVKTNRSLLSSECLQGPKPLTLPKPAGGDFVRWKSDLSGLENVKESDIIGGSIIATDYEKVFDTVAIMNASTDLETGQMVLTRGYSSIDDGGGASYLVRTPAQFGGTPDEYGDHTLANDNIAVLQVLGAGNVRQYGATGDAVTDDTDAIQAALDANHDVYIPEGKYIVSSVTLSKSGHKVTGAGMGQTGTMIVPTSGGNCFVIANDYVEITDLEFRDRVKGNNSVEPTLDANCIYVDAVTNNPSFTRLIQGCKIERVQFFNILGAGIFIAQALRESHIKDNRFFGVGDRSTGVGGIYCKVTKGDGSSTNNLFIRDNVFYRYAAPPIKLLYNTVVATSVPHYASIYISGNLIHNQKNDTSSNLQGVESEPTDNVVVEGASGVYIDENKVTSIHPDYSGISVIGHVDYEGRHVSITENKISGDTGRTNDGITYPGSGNLVEIDEQKTLVFTNNTIGVNSADRPNTDLTVTKTSAADMQIAISGNVTVNQPLDFNVTANWNGIYELQGVIQKRMKTNGFINIGGSSELTITAGSITPTGSRHSVAAASGTADNLDLMATADLEDGDIIIITPRSGDTITCRDGVSKFNMNGDAVLASVNDQVVFIYDSGTDKFNEISRSINGA
jgi:hypothetical protein